ncbi:LamG-like jellyroll fold domain-containing protein [Paenibacillus sp. FJAT-27812]|uniref:LamG-like jellyroll fold domain-containing protein n=1 Tax=Paenibacillus sp. FJAT-27812 TaxID=1684143 RepID=UPI0006A75C59|nr:LamG-like jellyroll fold domain-containing protein [Paenibacillus sp. FJAT-27812]
MFFNGKRSLALIIIIAVLCSNANWFMRPVSAADAVQAPVASVAGGRYEAAVEVVLSTSTNDASIYYTLDGTQPSDKSLKADNLPITIAKTTNLSAIAMKDGVASKAVAFGYLIKTAEKPLLQFVAMSDVHVGSRTTGDPRYESYFDTIASIFPNPDALLVVGDMINDNGGDKPNDHQMVREIFQANLARKNMTDTKMHVAMGNHDATVAKVNEHYPAEWFTAQSNGYYETQIGGYYFFFLNGNNYNSDTGQRNWLKGRLADITADPLSKNKPIFVGIHQPITGTVMDGQQASNPNLNSDLAGYPQVITLSGHSHLTNSDERSIFQKDYTALNLGSMSYIEAEHGYSAVTNKGLVSRFEFPVSQADFIEVYADRIEVDRIAFNADPADIMDNWTPVPPFNSVGTIAGNKWVIELKGNTNEEIKSNFKYTAANRNKVAPKFPAEPDLKVSDLDNIPKLSFNQAKDDQNMHHYEVTIINKRTGAAAKSVNVFSDYFFSPIPSMMSIPLDGLDPQTNYTANVTAVDSYGNKSSAIQQSFRTGGTAPELTPIDPETMWKDLVVDMSFDGNLSDAASGATGSAISVGSVTYVEGKSNKAAYIPAGNGNYIDLGNRSDLKFGSGSFTVSFWQTGNLSGDQTIISNKNWNSGKNAGWYIGPAVANAMTLNIADGNNRMDTSAGSVGNEWHLFTVTVDRANQVGKVYVDGVEKSSKEMAALGTSGVDTAFNTIIGADGNKGNGGANVTMDDLKIWKRTLSATEIKALSDSYKMVPAYTYEQLAVLQSEAAAFDASSSTVTGVTYSAAKLGELRAAFNVAAALTASSPVNEIDEAYVNLLLALEAAKDSVTYTFIPKSNFTIEAFSSYADNEDAFARNMLDGDPSTIWHSKWEAPASNFPHWVIMDAKNSLSLSGIQRTSRMNQTASEFPKEFEVYASDNLADLSDEAFLANDANKATGIFGKTWTGSTYKDFTPLNKTISGRYIKFVVKSTYNTAATFTSMSEIDFTGTEVEKQLEKASLKGDAKAAAGGSVELTYGLENVAGTVMAQDITIEYDPAKLAFVSAVSLHENQFVIPEIKDTNGQLRLLAVHLNEAQTSVNGDWMKLSFQVNTGVSAGQTFVTVKKAEVSDSLDEHAIAGASHAIEVTSLIGDNNHDDKISIVDLAMIVKAYGAKEGDSNWESVKFGDLNGDKVIDIVDLTQMAKLILNWNA